MTYFLKLRKNITLEGDVQLASHEIMHLFNKVCTISKDEGGKIPCFVPENRKFSNIREGKVIGFIATEPNVSAEKLILFLSFIQEIWCHDNAFDNKPYSAKTGDTFCAIPVMAMSEYLTYINKINEYTTTEIAQALAGTIPVSKILAKALDRANTSSPHVHSFHKYKAKFFPRFVRSLIVSNLDFNKENHTICDPYVGSGTTLIESALMGFDSFGYDIDSLSCFISETKAKALGVKINDLPISLPSICNKKIDVKYTFPEEIQRKFRRWGTVDEMYQFEKEISNELHLISNETGFYKTLNQIALSDALTRKFTIRMMGTGSGRFALEIGKTSLQSLLKANMVSSIHALNVISALKSSYGLTIKDANVYKGDATHRECADNSCDIIVTSPPYLPASSGREDYLVGKMISLKALGLYDDKEQIQNNSVGSMSSQASVSLDNLPESVAKLYNWLINDELRSIKAAPIVAYYNSLRLSLMEDKRTIKENGTIIYIIGKESIFYNNTTKEILYKVECDNIFKEIAESVGLKIKELVNIELDKKNAVARPRSSDKYYETAIVMTK